MVSAVSLKHDEAHSAVRTELRRFLQADPQGLLAEITRWDEDKQGSWQMLKKLSADGLGQHLSRVALRAFLQNWSSWVFNELAQLQSGGPAVQPTYHALFTVWNQLQRSVELCPGDVVFEAYEEARMSQQERAAISKELQAVQKSLQTLHDKHEAQLRQTQVEHNGRVAAEAVAADAEKLVEHLLSGVGELKENLKAFEEKKEESETARKEFQGQVQRLQAELLTEKQSRRSLEVECRRLQESLEAAHATKESLIVQLSEAACTAAAAKKGCVDKNAEIEHLERLLTDTQDKWATTIQEVEAASLREEQAMQAYHEEQLGFHAEATRTQEQLEDMKAQLENEKLISQQEQEKLLLEKMHEAQLAEERELKLKEEKEDLKAERKNLQRSLEMAKKQHGELSMASKLQEAELAHQGAILEAVTQQNAKSLRLAEERAMRIVEVETMAAASVSEVTAAKHAVDMERAKGCTEIERLQLQLEQECEINMKAAHAISKLKKRIAELETKAKERKAQLQDMKSTHNQEKQRLQSRLQNTQCRLEEVESERNQLEKDLQNRAEDLMKEKHNVADARQIAEMQKRSLKAELQEEKRAGKASRAQAAEEITRLTQMVTTSEQKQEAQKREFGQLTGEVQRAQQRLQEKSQALKVAAEDETNAKEMLSAELSQARHELLKTSEAHRRLSERLNIAETALKIALKDKEVAQDRVRFAEERTAGWRSQIAHLGLNASPAFCTSCYKPLSSANSSYASLRPSRASPPEATVEARMESKSHQEGDLKEAIRTRWEVAEANLHQQHIAASNFSANVLEDDLHRVRAEVSLSSHELYALRREGDC